MKNRAPSHLFTVTMGYRGGSYISQVEAPDAVGALRVWLTDVSKAELPEFGPARRRELIQKIESGIKNGDLPARVQDTVNVWCAYATCSGGRILIDIIQTER